jgi:hypothetical protein
MWALGSPGQEKVIKTFEGHTDKVKEFVWRIRGGDDLERDDRSFQLITWGMDQSLRFWPIRESTLLVGPTRPSRLKAGVKADPSLSFAGRWSQTALAHQGHHDSERRGRPDIYRRARPSCVFFPPQLVLLWRFLDSSRSERIRFWLVRLLWTDPRSSDLCSRVGDERPQDRSYWHPSPPPPSKRSSSPPQCPLAVSLKRRLCNGHAVKSRENDREGQDGRGEEEAEELEYDEGEKASHDERYDVARHRRQDGRHGGNGVERQRRGELPFLVDI